jgi:hypothetical protein
VGGDHAGGREGRAAHRESLLGVKKRGGGPQGRHRRWGKRSLLAQAFLAGWAGAAVSSWSGREQGQCSFGLGKQGGAASAWGGGNRRSPYTGEIGGPEGDGMSPEFVGAGKRGMGNFQRRRSSTAKRLGEEKAAQRRTTRKG